MINLFNLILPLVFVALVVVAFSARKVLALTLCGVALVPLGFIAHLLGSFAAENFPYTSELASLPQVPIAFLRLIR